MDTALYIGPKNEDDQSSYITVTYGEGDSAGAQTFYSGQPVEFDSKELLDSVKELAGGDDHEFAVGKAAVDKALAKADKDAGNEPAATTTPDAPQS